LLQALIFPEFIFPDFSIFLFFAISIFCAQPSFGVPYGITSPQLRRGSPCHSPTAAMSAIFEGNAFNIEEFVWAYTLRDWPQ